jgi:HSP20 family protein
MTLWNDLLGLQDELQRLLQTPASFFREPSAAGVYPPLNVFRGPHGLIVRAEIPGVEPGDVAITTEGQRLTISGERKPPERAAGSYHRRERQYGKFSRTVTLPDDIDGARTTASLRNGVLTLTVPQHESARPRRIEIAS